MMSDDITLSDDERAFEGYLDSLSGALQHGSRERPFRDYCTGLLLPDERGTDGGAAGALHHPDDAQEAVELRVGWGVERRGGAGGDAPRDPAGARGARRGAPLDRDRNGQEGHALGRRGPPGLWRTGQDRELSGPGQPVGRQRGGGVADRGSICRKPGAAIRCAAAGVPLDVTFRTKPLIALELIGRALAGGPPGMVLADEVYGSTAEFRRGVAGLGLDYALAVRTLVSPPCSGRRARLWRGQEDPLSVRALAAWLPRSAWRWITWREGGGPDLTGR